MQSIIKNKRILLVIIIVWFLIVVNYLVSGNVYGMLSNLIPEIIGIIITYEIVDWAIKNNEERRINPYKNTVYNKINDSLYSLIYGFFGVQVPENISKSLREILEIAKEELEDILEDNYIFLSKELIDELSNLTEKISNYLYDKMIGAPEMDVYQTEIDIIFISKNIAKLIDKKYLIGIIEEHRG